MAPPKKKSLGNDDQQPVSTNEDTDFSAELIKQINKEAGSKIAFNLGTEEAPTTVKRWISTGSKQLDYIISNRRNGGVAEGRIVEIQGPPSCHAKGSLIMGYDGNLIKAEDVRVGTVLMGPDSKPRTVKSVHSGTDMLYEFTPTSAAEPFTVNSNHILSLKRARGKKKNSKRVGEIIEIPVREYLNTSKTFKKNYRLYRANPVEFNVTQETKKPIPAYILGLLLGDGSLGTDHGGRIELTTADKEISQEYTAYCNNLGYEVSIHNKEGNKAFDLYHRTGQNPGKTVTTTDDKDKIRTALRGLKLLGTKSGNKFIPHVYKTASRHDRLELLAGLIDTDGHYDSRSNKYAYCSKSEQLAQDFAFVARSLGMNVSISDKFVNEELYQQIYLSGNHLKEISSRLERKQARASTSKKDFNLVGFSVKAKGEGEYYGFEVDGDHLFLSHDFLVFHNSGKSHIAYEIAKATQEMNGIVVYIDTENATSVENLEGLGIDIRKRFVFIQETCIEDIFKVIESTIEKARNLKADVPVTVIWDSVAASAPKAEIEGEYDQNTIGLAARVLSKGFRKITDVIGDKNVCLVLLNQQRQRIGVLYGDPSCVSPDTKVKIRRRAR
jgi:RecA/RadA recombinase